VCAWIRRSGSARAEEISRAELRAALDSPGTLVWVDIEDPGPEEIETLQQEFDFSPLSLEEVAKQRMRPKVDEYPNYYFLVMYVPLAPAPPFEELCTTEIDLFVGRNFVVTLHTEPAPALLEARNRWDRSLPSLGSHVGLLAHMVVDAIIDAYFPRVDAIEDRLDAVERTMFRRNSTANPEELLSLKRSLVALRKAVSPLRDAFAHFPHREHGMFAPETQPYYRDVYDHILRLLDIVDIQWDMLQGALDAHLAFISNQLNETMKTLTVLGICVAIAGAVFGAWG
jgi:magnesium transporter